MLQKLNERIQGVVAWVVIILIAVTFTLFGIDYYMQSRHESDAQVEVNDQPITKQAFELNYRRTRQLRDPALMTAASENQLKEQVLDQMVVNSVTIQSANVNGFKVSPAQADAAILSIPQFQQDGHFSSDRYQQALNGAFFTPESFQKEVSQGMLLNQQRFAFMGTAFALPSDIKQFVKLYMQTRDYDYLTIPALRFIKQGNITEQEVKSYYQQHQKEFLTPEKVSIDYIRLSMSDIKTNIKITDQKIKRYYEDNKSNYYTPAQWQVAHILLAVRPDMSAEEQKRVKQHAEELYRSLEKDPAKFDQDVKLVSDDKISAAKGGILPWIVAGQSEFDKTLINIKNPGQISPPVKSQHGYEIFKLVSYKPATVKPLQDVKGAILDQLTSDHAQTLYAQALEKLSDLSYQTPDSLTPVAEALKLTIQESVPFSRMGGDSDLTKNKQVINAAFNHDVIALGNNSEPVQLDNENVVVLRVNKHIAATEKTLIEVRPLIEEKLAKIRAKGDARQLGKTLLNANQNLAEQDKLIKDNQLQWQAVTVATRDAEAALVTINEMAFNLPRVGAEVGRSLVDGDYVIVHLKRINDGQLSKLDKEQMASVSQQIEANYGMMDYDLYISELMSKSKIVKR
jgi:peptidyl-prolyl cis-trans isomerase D